MSEEKKREYKNFLENVIDWAKRCLEILRFQKAWQKGQVPEAEMAGPIRTSEEEEKLVQEIFSPSSTFPTKKKASRGFDIQSIEIEVYGPKKPEDRPMKSTSESESPASSAPSPDDSEVSSTTPETANSEDTPGKESADPIQKASDSTSGEPDKKLEPSETVPPSRASVEDSAVPRSGSASTEESEEEKSYLLVIDDYEPLLNMLARSLKSAGYEPICAKDGVEGIVKLHEHAVDLIITDVQMPKLDGFDLSKMLNVREETRDIPVIFLTEVLDDRTRTVAKRLGAADTIIKPFTMDTLLESVKTVLLSHKAVVRKQALEETVSTP